MDLNLHSVDEIDKAGLSMLARGATGIEKLDVSFVRDVDDFVVKEILHSMEGLKTLVSFLRLLLLRLRVLICRIQFVHGDNRVTSKCPQKVRLKSSLQANTLMLTSDLNFCSVECRYGDKRIACWWSCRYTKSVFSDRSLCA